MRAQVGVTSWWELLSMMLLWNLEVKRMVRARVCILYTREGRRLVRTNLA